MAGAGYVSPTQSGITILPSPSSFQQYALQAGSTTQLAWPVDNAAGNSTIVALLNNLNPLGPGCIVQMPAAVNTSLGEKGLFFNSGSVPFVLSDSTGVTILSIAPGTAWYIALTNNLTTGGTWLVFQFGAGTAAVNAAALAGAGLSASGAVLQQIMSVTTLTANYTVGTADRDNLLNWAGGAGSITLPLAASVGNNFYIQTRNSGTGTLTYATQGADQINGTATSLNFNVNDSAFIVTDGVGWFTIGLGSIQTAVFNFQVVSLAGQSGTYVLPANQQNKIAYRFTGALAGNTNVQVPTTIQQYWVDNSTTGAFTLGIGTAAQITGATQLAIAQGTRYVTYCDGTNVLNAATAGISFPIAVNQGGTGAITATAALVNLGGTSIGTGVFTAATAASAQSTLGVLSTSDAWALAVGM